jgi:hypothetical protein
VSRPLYDRFAWAYDELVPDPAGLSVERVAELLEPGCVVGDAGCGTGRYGPVEQSAGGLRYRTETTLDGGLMRIHETYGDELHEFTMRPWTPAEVRDAAAAAGFAHVDVRPGGDVGIAADRLLVVARVG